MVTFWSQAMMPRESGLSGLDGRHPRPRAGPRFVWPLGARGRGGSDDQAAVLRHHRDSLRQWPATPRLRAGDRAGGRARAALSPARSLTGTDDNSLKNVQAAEAEGVPVRDLVDRNAAAYAALRDPLGLSFDDFICTSSDPRHRAGVERLWRACQASGDLYRKLYQGLYCVGCEQFYAPAELEDGRCPEHGTEPQLVTEENWFFRLSRYRERLAELIESGTLRIEPASRRNEVLGLIAGGLEDFSVSRSVTRSRGWGIGVPGDPDQVIYVWFDALANYLTALGYGTDAPAYHQWW